jgi:hypothetical protein
MGIEGVSAMVHRLLAAEGEVFVEDDYPWYKEWYLRKRNGIMGAFTWIEVVVMTPSPTARAEDGLEFRFVLYADPARIGRDKRAFGKKVREDDCRVLAEWCESFMREAGLEPGGPWVRAVRPRPRRKDMTVPFTERRRAVPAYEVELFWFLPGKVTKGGCGTRASRSGGTSRSRAGRG